MNQLSWMNQLSRVERAQIIRALVEGNSIRYVSRMTGFTRNTISSVLVQIRRAASEYQHRTIVNLPTTTIECDVTSVVRPDEGKDGSRRAQGQVRRR